MKVKGFRKLLFGMLILLMMGSSAPELSHHHSLTTSQEKEIVERHNYWRAKEGVAPLKWSEELAAYAREWAEGCKFQHRTSPKYGENLYAAFSSGGEPESSPSEVVDAWASEIKFVKKGKWEKCFPKCGHYSQLMWKNTRSVGCARYYCPKKNMELWVCNYDPPGNVRGQAMY